MTRRGVLRNRTGGGRAICEHRCVVGCCAGCVGSNLFYFPRTTGEFLGNQRIRYVVKFRVLNVEVIRSSKEQELSDAVVANRKLGIRVGIGATLPRREDIADLTNAGARGQFVYIGHGDCYRNCFREAAIGDRNCHRVGGLGFIVEGCFGFQLSRCRINIKGGSICAAEGIG